MLGSAVHATCTASFGLGGRPVSAVTPEDWSPGKMRGCGSRATGSKQR